MDRMSTGTFAYSRLVELLGLPVQLQSDSAALLDAALAAVLGAAAERDATADFGAFTEATPETGGANSDRVGIARLGTDGRPAITVRLRLAPDLAPGECGEARNEERGRDLDTTTRPDGVLEITGQDVRAAASLRDMRAEAWMRSRLVEEPAPLREVLTTLILYLLTRLDRQPLHAAAIANGHHALLLAGPSGAGKSTLAYLAHRAGLRVLADDAVYVQLEPGYRLWGMPGPLHLSADAAARFPELNGIPAVVRRGNGRYKLAIGRAGVPPPTSASGICILEPGVGTVSLEPISLDEAVRHVLARLDPGFDVFAGSIESRVRAAGRLGTWRLGLSDDAEAAFRVVAELLTGL